LKVFIITRKSFADDDDEDDEWEALLAFLFGASCGSSSSRWQKNYKNEKRSCTCQSLFSQLVVFVVLVIGKNNTHMQMIRVGFVLFFLMWAQCEFTHTAM
jgi:hypothetical protein